MRVGRRAVSIEERKAVSEAEATLQSGPRRNAFSGRTIPSVE